jgi:hypothetical protein
MKTEKRRGNTSNEASVGEISYSSFFPTHNCLLEVDLARGGTHRGCKVEMDERRLNRDESTKLVCTARGGDKGQGAWVTDFDLCDVRFLIVRAFLLDRPIVGGARDDAVFDEGVRTIAEAGERSKLFNEGVRGLATAEATSDERTSDPRTEAICPYQLSALVWINDSRLDISEVKLHSPLLPIFYLCFRIQ